MGSRYFYAKTIKSILFLLLQAHPIKLCKNLK
nr:MAG TPA: hypothetical protein [Caudoviricetes sp.]